MSKKKVPVTPAIRALRAAGIAFEGHLYDYEDKGGTKKSAQALGVDEHRIVKTLIMEDEHNEPLVVLMHGDRQVSAQALARQLGKKSIRPCVPEVAEKHSGYQVGGTSPFGRRKEMPVYAERSLLELPRIYINGGKRGFLVSLDPREAIRVLGAEVVDVAAGAAAGRH